MAQDINISKDLYDLLVSKNFDPQVTDTQGQETTPDEGSVFKFDYVSSSGKNYGTAVALIGDDKELMLFFGDNLGKSMDDEGDKDEWFGFLQQLSKFATRHNFHTFTPKNLNAIKHTMAGMAAIKEGLFEGYYGNRRVSYMGEATDARLVIKHNRLIGEDDKRYRYVESLFIETADGERFRLPFNKLVGGRAMLEHVRQGGKPYDIRGCHIAETVNEMAVLARFNRASQNKMFEGQTQQLVEAAREYYQNLQTNLKHMGSARGYQTYFESWTPADVGEQEALVEDLKTMFIEQTLDTRIEAALPTLAKIQGSTMKEADQFESWANKLVEGTWALPETPEAKDKLYSLLNQELPVGPDAANATEQLYDILGDDELFDRLGDLADRDANADARPVIIARMKEMGMQVPGVKPEPEVNEGDNLATFEAGCDMDESMGATVAGAVAPLEEGSSDYVGNAIEDLRVSKPGLDRETFLDELYSYLDAQYGKRVADMTMDHGNDAEYDEYYANYSDLAEGDPGYDKHSFVGKIRRGIEADNKGWGQLGNLFAADNEKDAEKALRKGNRYYNMTRGSNKTPGGFPKTTVEEQGVAEGSEQVYRVLAVDKSNALSKQVKLKVKASSLDEVFERLAVNDWYPLEINGIEVVNGKRLKQGMDEDSTDSMDHRGAVTDSFYEDLARLKKLAFVKRT